MGNGIINIYYRFTGKIETETKKAILFNFGSQEYWLPKSQIGISFNNDSRDVVYIPEWLATKRNLPMDNPCEYNLRDQHEIPILEIPDEVEIPDDLKD